MARPKILIVDDEPFNVDYLEQELEDFEYDTVSAFNGQEALEQVENETPDLILLDIMMPEMDGFQVLELLKADDRWRHIPVIVISAINDLDNVVRGIKLGAIDYLPKPFNEVILHARIESGLEKKRWRDQEQAYLAEIQRERAKSEQLLLNILPAPIAERLKQGEGLIVDDFSDVTVLFADIVGFTTMSAQTSPQALVDLLNNIFSAFDRLAEQHGLEKIKTIGDAYMAVGGLPEARPDSAKIVADMALDMRQVIQDLSRKAANPLSVRIGIHSGPVVAGVIGHKKFSYDLWGDTVNTASRMESHGVPGQIQVSQATYERLEHSYRLDARGTIQVKGKGEQPTYFLLGKI